MIETYNLALPVAIILWAVALALVLGLVVSVLAIIAKLVD